MLTQLIDARIHVAPTIDAIIERLATRARTLPPGDWIEAVGYNEAQLPEGRHLTRHDLDRASAAHPAARLEEFAKLLAEQSSCALWFSIADAEASGAILGCDAQDRHMYDNSMLAETGIATSLAWPLTLQPRPLDGNDTLGIRITIAGSYLCMVMIAHHSL